MNNIHKKPLPYASVLLALVLGVGFLLMACATVAGQRSAATPSDFTIKLSEAGLTVPEQLPTGPVAITFNNIGQMPHSPDIARLNKGVTVEEVMAAIEGEDPMVALALVQLLGGTEVAPGTSQRIVYDLKQGTHLVVDFGEEDGPPATAVFEAAGEGGLATAPEADVRVEMKDFAFIMPDQIKAGPQTWQIENTGEQWHELAIIKLDEGKTLADIIAVMHQEGEAEGPMPFEDVAFWAPMGHGERAWVTFDLEPGEYTVLCFLPDLAGGTDYSHLEHGMIRQLTVIE